MRLRLAFSLLALSPALFLLFLTINTPVMAAPRTQYSQTDSTSIPVTTSNDELNSDGDCSLREAIVAANTNQPVDACPAGGDADVILLPAGVYKMSLAGSDDTAQTGDFDLLGEVTLQGESAATTVIDGGGLDRVLHVLPDANATLSSLTIQGGQSNDDSGGGIRNEASLRILDSNVSSNSSLACNEFGCSGWTGGGIWSSGSLLVDHSQINGNRAGYVPFGSDFQDLAGGGIWSSGLLTVTESFVNSNTGGTGAGIAAYGSSYISDTQLNGNRNKDAGAGLANWGDLFVANSQLIGNISECFPPNPCHGSGGGVANLGTAIIQESNIGANYIYDDGQAQGGGILNQGDLTLLRSAVYSNTADGSSPNGGGIFNGGTFTVSNSTISGNLAEGSFGQSPRGGGIHNANTMTLNNSTVAGNILQCPTDSCTDGLGGGVVNQGSLAIANSLVANNQGIGNVIGPDCQGIVTSQGYNLIRDPSGCTITGDSTGNVTGEDPLLGPLQDNGGPTLTHALLAGSPAIDSANPSSPGAGGNSCEVTDQRGIARPQDGNSDGAARCDIGAYEVQALTGEGTITIIKDAQPNSHRNFRFTGDLGTFRLDDALPADHDPFSDTKTFTRASGVYRVREEVAGNWLLSNISCDPAATAAVELANSQVTITLSANSHVTCTFTNQRKATVRAAIYEDRNANGHQNRGERPLSGWHILLYNAQGKLVSAGDHQTNQHGKVSYPGLPPGNYTVCEGLKSGWSNTQPGIINPNFAQPCYLVTVGPGQIAQLTFGNVHHPVAGIKQPDPSSGVLIFDTADAETDEANSSAADSDADTDDADTDDADYEPVDTDEEWLNTPLQATDLFIPLISSGD